MDGLQWKTHENPMNKWMIWEVSHIFGSTPVSWCIKLQKQRLWTSARYPPCTPFESLELCHGRPRWRKRTEGNQQPYSRPSLHWFQVECKLHIQTTQEVFAFDSQEPPQSKAGWSRKKSLEQVPAPQNYETLYPIPCRSVYYSMKVPSTSSFFKKTWRFDHLQISAICWKNYDLDRGSQRYWNLLGFCLIQQFLRGKTWGKMLATNLLATGAVECCWENETAVTHPIANEKSSS